MKEGNKNIKNYSLENLSFVEQIENNNLESLLKIFEKEINDILHKKSFNKEEIESKYTKWNNIIKNYITRHNIKPEVYRKIISNYIGNFLTKNYSREQMNYLRISLRFFNDFLEGMINY